MPDLISDQNGDLAFPLPPRTAAMLKQAMARADAKGARAEVFDLVILSIEEALRELEGSTDAKEPTYSQVSYAVAVARDLSIALPGDALRYRRAMQRFLSEFAPLHRRLTSK